MTKNFYEVLGVDPKADPITIKKAYRTLALQYHPDKLSGVGASEKAAAEETFKAIGNAYETLSDEELRNRYDLGRAQSFAAAPAPQSAARRQTPAQAQTARQSQSAADKIIQEASSLASIAKEATELSLGTLQFAKESATSAAAAREAQKGWQAESTKLIANKQSGQSVEEYRKQWVGAQQFITAWQRSEGTEIELIKLSVAATTKREAEVRDVALKFAILKQQAERLPQPDKGRALVALSEPSRLAQQQQARIGAQLRDLKVIFNKERKLQKEQAEKIAKDKIKQLKKVRDVELADTQDKLKMAGFLGLHPAQNGQKLGGAATKTASTSMAMAAVKANVGLLGKLKAFFSTGKDAAPIPRANTRGRTQTR